MSRRESVKGRWVVKLNRTRFLFFLWQLDRIRFRATRFASQLFFYRRIRRRDGLDGVNFWTDWTRLFISFSFFFQEKEERFLTNPLNRSFLFFRIDLHYSRITLKLGRSKRIDLTIANYLQFLSFPYQNRSPIDILEFLNKKKKRKRVLWK